MPSPRYTTAAELARADPGWAAGDPPGVAGRRRYSTSKLCNLLFTYEAARRWGGRGITFNAFDPGWAAGDPPGVAGRRRYSTSKLCNLLFTYEAARRWGGRGITFNAFDPG